MPGAMHEITRRPVAGEESFENVLFDFCGGSDLLWCMDLFQFRRWCDEAANEPTAEPPRRDLAHHRGLTIRQRGRHRRHIFFVGDAEMVEALANAPRTWTRRPVQLLERQRLRESDRALVGGIELGNQTVGPAGSCIVKPGSFLQHRFAGAGAETLSGYAPLISLGQF